MADWITLQETAERIGVRKGTLCMWRNRNKFPFKTKGTGKTLEVEITSIDAWLVDHKDDLLKGRNRLRKPMKETGGVKTVAKKPTKKPGRKPGR